MPVLDNPKHERFAQDLAKGRTQIEAYEAAGYKPNASNAAQMAKRPEITDRVTEINTRAAEKAGVTVERIVTELAKIGFSDIRKAVNWVDELVKEEDNPDGGETLVIKHIHNNRVSLIGSEDIDDETAAAISEIRQNQNGGVTVKFHDKRAALVDLGKHLGMFREKTDVNVQITLGDIVGASITQKQDDAA